MLVACMSMLLGSMTALSGMDDLNHEECASVRGRHEIGKGHSTTATGCPTRRDFRRVGTTDLNFQVTRHIQRWNLCDRRCLCPQGYDATTAQDTFTSLQRAAIGAARCSR